MALSSKSPILVELTAEEAAAYNLAGNSPDEGIQTQIELILVAGQMSGETAAFMAKKLAKAAICARAKITAATRFEIRVVSPPKASTLLKKSGKKPAKKKPKSPPQPPT